MHLNLPLILSLLVLLFFKYTNSYFSSVHSSKICCPNYSFAMTLTDIPLKFNFQKIQTHAILTLVMGVTYVKPLI